MADRRPMAAWGGVAGPVSFLTAWAVGGTLRAGYDPVEQAISRLAETGASSRALMTAGFAGLAAGFLAASAPLARHLSRPAGASLAATALATAGVALTPLKGDLTNTPHTILAVAGYASLAAVPLLAAPALDRAGHRRWAVASAVAGVASAALLAASGTGPGPGLLQRLGLTVGHAWVAVTCAALATGRLGARRSAPPPAAAAR